MRPIDQSEDSIHLALISMRLGISASTGGSVTKELELMSILSSWAQLVISPGSTEIRFLERSSSENKDMMRKLVFLAKNETDSSIYVFLVTPEVGKPM